MPSHLGPTFSLERAWTGFSLYAHKLRCLQCTQKIIILPNISSSLMSRYNCKLYIYNMPRPLYVIQKEKLRSNIFVTWGWGGQTNIPSTLLSASLLPPNAPVLLKMIF